MVTIFTKEAVTVFRTQREAAIFSRIQTRWKLRFLFSFSEEERKNPHISQTELVLRSFVAKLLFKCQYILGV